MQSSSSYSRSVSIPQLRTLFDGRVLAPGDAEYDAARTPFYGGIDRKPAAIVRPIDAAEVARVVTFAREADVELAIRSGGHSLAGYCISDGGLVLDLSKMRALEIDVDRRTAWAQAGLTTGEYTAAAAEHGLATGFGDTGTVGIGGITTGGGIGFLIRKHGLTIDDVLAAEVVTADGQVLQANATSHPDLFWAIRGGGGNFGVVTRFQFRLHPLPSIVGGMMFLPASADLLHKFVAQADASPEELTAIVNVMKAPPMPPFPPAYHGKLVIMAFLVWAGETEAGLKAVAPFRTLATPILDMVGPKTYPEMFPPEPHGYHPVAAARTMFVDAVPRAMTDAMFEQLETSTAKMPVTQVRLLGGAASRVSSDATAYAHRGRNFMINIAALYDRPEEASVHQGWVARYASAINPDDTSAYVNFIGAEGQARVRDAYPDATWERLRRIKRQYDPANVFRLNQNIPPA